MSSSKKTSAWEWDVVWNVRYKHDATTFDVKQFLEDLVSPLTGHISL